MQGDRKAVASTCSVGEVQSFVVHQPAGGMSGERWTDQLSYVENLQQQKHASEMQPSFLLAVDQWAGPRGPEHE